MGLKYANKEYIYMFRSKMYIIPLCIVLVGLAYLVFILIRKGRTLVCDASFDGSYRQHYLPTFQNFHDLKAHHHSWYTYLTHLYSDAQLENMMPLSISQFWVLYPKLLPMELFNSLCVKLMPRFPRDVYHGMLVLDVWDGMQMAYEHLMLNWDVLFIYQYDRLPGQPCDLSVWHRPAWDVPLPISAAQSFEIIEIIRFPDQVGSSHWFYYGKGSGIWINVGTTIWFRDHQEAYEHFGVEGYFDGGHTQQDEEMLAGALRANGYDTVQFLCTTENVYKYEIMTVQSKQTIAGSPCVDIATFGKDMKPCRRCRADSRIINCQQS